jgi:hypothetical protein
VVQDINSQSGTAHTTLFHCLQPPLRLFCLLLSGLSFSIYRASP